MKYGVNAARTYGNGFKASMPVSGCAIPQGAICDLNDPTCCGPSNPEPTTVSDAPLASSNLSSENPRGGR